MNRKHLRVLFGLTLLFFACQRGAEDMVAPFLGFQPPAHFPAPAYRLANNPVTKDGFELGRALFYDPILSINNTVACGSCHIQTSAFTHHGHTVSHGIFDRLGTRNSPPIFNLAWHTSFMWDGGIADLNLQAIAPLTHHDEMGETMPNVLAKLRSSDKYRSLFGKAFGTEEISTANFLKALSQFMLMCVSSESKWDSVVRGDAGVQFTAAEAAGRTLVQQKCGSCHAEPLFMDHRFRNNGLTPSSVNDEGHFLITHNPSDRYKFKVPSLRNLAFTAPYMHDGRLHTLDAVLDHYVSGIENMPTLDSALKQGSTSGIALTTAERTNILAFLNTLNDRHFLFDRRFAEP